MNEARILAMLELRSLYSINKYRHTKDKKAKNRYTLLAAVWAFLVVMVFAYIGGLVYGFCLLGLPEIIPSYLVMMASLLIIVFGIFKAGNALFSNQGYDILCSMPLRTESVVFGRFFAMYIEDLLFALVIMLPGVAVFGACEQPKIGFYMVALVGTCFIPAIPLVISALLGTAVMAVSSRMKHKSIVQAVLMVAFVVVVFVGSYAIEGAGAENFSVEEIASFATVIAELIGRIYIPAVWLGDAMLYRDMAGLLLFCGSAAGLLAFAVWLVSVNYHHIMHRLSATTAKHDYQMGTLESRSLLSALYRKEAKRYFASGIYVTNTIVGPILGCLLSAGLMVAGVEQLQGTIPLELDINALVPFFVAAVFCTMTATSVSISMEGKQVWIVQSLPIPTKALFDAKILFNISLVLPFYLLSEVFLVAALKPDLLELVWLILLPAVLIFFSLVFGITVNLKFHSFDWEREEVVVKQSASAMFGGFAGMLLSLAAGGVVFAVPVQYGNVAKAGICLLLAAVTVVLYRKNNEVELQML